MTRRIGYWPGRAGPWREWFAWRPVRLGRHGRIAWLRTVKRRFVTCWDGDGYGLGRGICWEYRE